MISRITSQAWVAARGVTRCAISPSHALMMGGFALDQSFVGHDSLCITSFDFDLELFLYMVSGCPGMSAGMIAGVAFECVLLRPRRGLLSGLATLTAGFLAMFYGHLLFPQGPLAAFGLMLGIMVLVDQAFMTLNGALPRRGDISVTEEKRTHFKNKSRENLLHQELP